MTAADIALSYAAKGWHVLPAPVGLKHPSIPQWQNAALTTEQIEGVWFYEPGPNISLLTGHGFDVLDVDAHDGKPKGTDFLGNEHGRPMPKGPIALTGSGGLHYYIAATGAGNERLGIPGVDYRGRGGQVLAPPSVHPDTGLIYRWLDGHGPEVPLPPAPYWLQSLIDRLHVPDAIRTAEKRPSTFLRPDITEVAALLGLTGKHAGRSKYMTVCPFHAGSGMPSLAIYTNDDTFRCWSPRCGAWGDSLDLAAHRAATGETF